MSHTSKYYPNVLADLILTDVRIIYILAMDNDIHKERVIIRVEGLNRLKQPIRYQEKPVKFSTADTRKLVSFSPSIYKHLPNPADSIRHTHEMIWEI